MAALNVGQPPHSLTTQGVMSSSEGVHIGNNVYIVTTEGVPTGGDGWAGIGSMAVDRTNGDLYLNTGTKTTPSWTKQT